MTQQKKSPYTFILSFFRRFNESKTANLLTLCDKNNF